jgi:hypothetical protein
MSDHNNGGPPTESFTAFLFHGVLPSESIARVIILFIFIVLGVAAKSDLVIT